MINNIIHGDCLEVMKNIPDKSVDMVLCDLPYNLTQNKWDVRIPFVPLWSNYSRIIKDNGAMVFTAAEPFATQLISSNIDLFKYDLVWVKNKPTGFLNSKKMPLRIHERILVFYKKPPVYNPQKTHGHKPVNSYVKHTSDGDNYGKTKRGVVGGGQTDRYPTSILKINVHNNDSTDKFHPTQKPVELYEWLIKTYTNEGDTVLDNAAGACTLAIACLKNNRNYICIEKEKEFCDIGVRRVNNFKGVPI